MFCLSSATLRLSSGHADLPADARERERERERETERDREREREKTMCTKKTGRKQTESVYRFDCRISTGSHMQLVFKQINISLQHTMPLCSPMQ